SWQRSFVACDLEPETQSVHVVERERHLLEPRAELDLVDLARASRRLERDVLVEIDGARCGEVLRCGDDVGDEAHDVAAFVLRFGLGAGAGAGAGASTAGASIAASSPLRRASWASSCAISASSS